MITQRLKSLSRFQSLFALALVFIGLSITAGSWSAMVEFWGKFFTRDNGLTVLRQISTNVCLSIGMTLVILSGGIDLSVGSVLALAGAIAAGLLKNGLDLPVFGVALQFTLVGAIVAGIGVGLALGWFNGFVITRFRLPPFIATLAMLGIARGLTMLWTHGDNIAALGDDFAVLGTGRVFGLPVPVLISATLVAVFVFVTRRTCFGRYIYAVGDNEKAAKLSGIYVDRIKRRVYILGGALAGIAGLLLASRIDAASPTAGVGYELDSIAAVVIGGTSLSGGSGSILGTVMGCLIIGVLNNGLSLLGISADWQMVVKGLVIYVAVAVDRASRNED